MENEKITELLGNAKTAWDHYLAAIRNDYEMDELWDGNELKFRRSGKTLVTLYIKEGFFTVLVIFGKAEREKFEAQRDTFPQPVQALYQNSRTFHDGKWMFLDTADDSLVPDLMRMLAIKRRPNRKTEGKTGQKSDFIKEFLSQIPAEY